MRRSDSLKVCEAQHIAGSLSTPSKMPGYGYGLPAAECLTGSKLRKVPGTVCSKCYGCKGQYVFPSCTNAQYYRLGSVDNPAWIDAMVAQIGNKPSRHFRWHDSGDLQSLEHLCAIVEIARRLPDVSFWLPTKEYGIVREYLTAHTDFPPNLCVRLSAYRIDGGAPTWWPTVSTTHTDATVYPKAHICPAYAGDGTCGQCRACWDRNVPHVSYHLH